MTSEQIKQRLIAEWSEQGKRDHAKNVAWAKSPEGKAWWAEWLAGASRSFAPSQANKP